MNALDRIRDLIKEFHEKGCPIDEIVSHDRVVSRGYVFVVRKRDKCYIMVNPNDLTAAIANLYMGITTRHIREYTMGVPINDDWQNAINVAQGVYECAFSVR